jgi:hypothetical protein
MDKPFTTRIHPLLAPNRIRVGAQRGAGATNAVVFRGRRAS